MENKQTAEWQSRIQQGAETIAAGMLSGNSNLTELVMRSNDIWAMKIARAAVAISRQIALISHGIEE